MIEELENLEFESSELSEELENLEFVNSEFVNSELPAVIGTLLDSLDDKDQDVKLSVIESIERISKQNPETVIHSAIYFWEMHKKISAEHSASLLNIISSICKRSPTSLNQTVATALSELAVNELKGKTECEAAEVLIELCKIYCVQAMGGLLSKLEPGIIPNAAIVSTIGKLAAANPNGILPFLKIVLTIIVPMLNQIREEVLKQEVCFMLSKLWEALNDVLMNKENLNLEINKQLFEEEFCFIYDFLIQNWLRTSRDFKSTEAILNALVFIIPLLFDQQNNERSVKLIPICLSFSKKINVRLASVRVLATTLKYLNSANDKEAIRPFIDLIHQTVFEYIIINHLSERMLRELLLTHYEVLHCYKSLVILYPEEGLDRILQQLKSLIANHRARALIVLKYLINTLPTEDDGSLQRIALSLQESLGEDNSLQMISAIATLARSAFPLLPSQRAKFIHYMVMHCETKDDTTECSTALYLLATTVDGVESWLWPCLIQALLDPACVTSIKSVLRSLISLARKIVHNENSSIEEKDFPGIKVLGRCLELLCNPANRVSVLTFLRAVAPLVGHQVKLYWDEKLLELSQENWQDAQISSSKSHQETKDMQRALIWEKEIVEWLEESVKLEGESWGNKIAEEMALKASTPNVALFLAATCNNNAHITLLVELARSHGNIKEFARAVGICAKRHTSIVLKLMEEFCTLEDNKKVRMKLLGLMIDTKANATAEAVKAGLLQSYAEIAQRGDMQILFPSFEKHILPWTMKQLSECKELSTKEAGLLVLEKGANAICFAKFPEFKGLHIKTFALNTLLGMLQTAVGYRPLQLYLPILKAIKSLTCIGPMLNNEEREIFLSSILDKTISAGLEMEHHLNKEIMIQVIDELGYISSEIVSDSADALAELVNILFPWMQSKSNIERKITLLILHTVLQSYYNSLKYTYPGGKLNVGQLIGRIFCWCADNDCMLRPLVIDCLLLSLDIAARHRHILLESTSIGNLQEIKQEMVENFELTYGTVKKLAKEVSNKVPSGEIVGFAEGLIQGLLFYGDTSLIAGIGLTYYFKIRGSEISKVNISLIDTIIKQIRQIKNRNSIYIAIISIISLMKHCPKEACELLLSQPLPLDPGTKLCWQQIGNDEYLGCRALEFLLIKLDFSNEFTINSEKNNTASLTSLGAIISLKYLLESPNMEKYIYIHLPKLLAILLQHLSAWLRIEAPASLIDTKYGYVPNREAQKMKPYAEVHSIIINIVTIIDPNLGDDLLAEIASSEMQTEEQVIRIVQLLTACIINKNDHLLVMMKMLYNLKASIIVIQRAVAATFYAELMCKVTCEDIWLERIISTLHQFKTDSSSLVRKHAIIGIGRLVHLNMRLINKHFNDCMDALLNGLEETAGGEGGTEVVLESLKGLSMLLLVQFEKPVSSRVVLALKPFIEKENWQIKFFAIKALNSIATNWRRFIELLDEYQIECLLGCLPSLIIRLEDSNQTIASTAQETLYKVTTVLPNPKLSQVIYDEFNTKINFNFETFSKVLINCLKEEYPERAEELRNAVVRGYSKSENDQTRATSALLLGLFSPPRPEATQRLLQLLRDTKSIVRIRASQALSFCFTL